MEFWATWCGPCVAAIPHLNDLAKRFKNKPVQFIAITDEAKATVEKFLARRPIHAWVVLDTNQAMNHAYAVEAIPHTVVLGKHGRIAAITDPTRLTAKVIENLLAGKKISLPGAGSGAMITAGKAPGNESQARPLFQVLIRASAYTNALGSASGNGSMTATGYTVSEALPIIFDVNSDRIVTNAPLPKGRYDFVVTQRWPLKSHEDADTLLQAAVKSAFGLTAERQTNQMNTFILKVKETNAPGLAPSPTRAMSWNAGPGSMSGVGVSVADIASFLENEFKAPVVNETGLTNRFGYDVSLKWQQKSHDKPDWEGLKRAVQEQLGLELIPERRPIEVLVIERVKTQDEPKKP